ncbi:NAD(P)/FAD-dependent oxidoreductase [Ammoniphilus sp. YIM 78166]|uniref:NAD(P)/FAD-dependent oxidoreductase n=1 Tax=Ammoniphilus sp. YIM 78166 TaxID=1644106 RepID=UPI0010700FEF|nr:NAD(P)/FAD-dependent oxidoreductase [Ammoniphilus sp. YIM 78166]
MKKVVILGAGYGGLMTAVQLQERIAGDEAELILVNKHDYHSLTTWLHEPAAGTLHHDRCRIDIRSLLRTNRTRFVKGVVEAIQPDVSAVRLADGERLEYDYLVVALGSEPETFGIQGLKEHAFSIRSINSVRMIREHIEYMFSRFRNEPHRSDYLTFVVGGAGFTGIEFVGELADRIPGLCREFDVEPSQVKIYNIEAAPTVLPGFDPELTEYAMKVLSEKGVIFRINTPIQECSPEGVVLATGEKIPSSTVVWTGGVRGSSIIEKSGFEVVRGRVKVDHYLRSPGYSNVFVIGDSSVLFDPETGRPYPPTAQIAIQQGIHTATNIKSLLEGGELQAFHPELKGTVASLGKGEAIGMVGQRKLVGSSASKLKKIIDNRYLFTLGGFKLLLQKAKL